MMITEVNLLKIPQEQVNMEPAGRLTAILTALLLFVCVISIAFYTYTKSVDPSTSPKDLLLKLKGTAGNTVEEAKVQYSFDFESRDKAVIAIYGDYIVKCSSGGIWFLDKKGEILWTESLSFRKPILKSGGSRLMAADIGAGEICVLDGRSILWSDKLDVAILNADISVDGYVTVITSSKRDNNEIRIYDPHGVELFRKIIANDFAVSALISPSEKILAVSGISTDAVGAYSNYKFYDMEGKELAGQSFEASGELLPIFWYNNDDSIFAAGDRAAATLDKSGKIIWEKQFKSISGASPAGSKRFAAAVESDEGIQLELYSIAGEEISSCKLQGKPNGLTAISGVIAVYTYDTIYFYNDKCKNIGKYSSNSHIQRVYFFNRQQAVVITDNSITVINIS